MNNIDIKQLIQNIDFKSIDIKALYRWWVHELIELIPRNIKRFLYPQHGVVRFQIINATVNIVRQEEENPNDLERIAVPLSELYHDGNHARLLLDDFDPNITQVEACLASDKVLFTELELPEAVEENLKQVLTFEMDRYTPFTPDRVYFHYSVIGRDEGMLKVRLGLTPKKHVHALLDKFEQWGVHLDRVYFVNSEQDFSARDINLKMNFISEERRIKKKQTGSRLNLVLAGGFVLLLIVCFALPLVQKSIQVEQLNEMMKAARKEANRTNDLESKLNAMIDEANFLVNKKKQSPDVLKVLNEVTTLLPNDSWIHLFELNGNEVRIQGKSPAASSLLGKIEASELLQKADFKSPVTRDSRTNLERFHIAAEIEGLQKDAKK